MMESAIYQGSLRHRRFRPRRHEFSYPLFMAFLDVDRLPELMRVSPFAAYNRWNWASYHERDHVGDPTRPLRARLAADAAAHGLTLPDGPVFLLTHLRYLGYVFNPVSFFYCYDRDATLRLVLAEVNNTFGESRNYWLSAPDSGSSGRVRRYRAPKSLHVSPFMPMTLEYDFAIAEPGARLAVSMRTLDETGRAGGPPLFDATLTLTREPWSRTALHRALRRQPWMTASVIAGIHWEALKLYLKRVPVYTHPGRAARGSDALASRRTPVAGTGEVR
jgi:DUF1365 family protein